MALNDTKIRSIKFENRIAKYSDGGGLYLHVSSGGSRLWRMAYRFAGKQKTLSFGAYPDVSLMDARRRRDEAKKQLASGSDPSDLVRLAKLQSKNLSQNTFGAIADELIIKNERESKAKATLAKKQWLLEMAKQNLGHRPITDLSAAEILIPLKKVEAKEHYETARRLRAAIGQVFRYAIATGRAENDPTFGLRGALINPVVRHRAAILNEDDFAKLVKDVWNYHGATETRAALKLMAMLYPRPGELRQAEWSEFDLEKSIWTIPASQTKMRREHQKPLPRPALNILKELRGISSSNRLVFPSSQSAMRPLSENTLNLALRRMGYGKTQMTSHGFRASASTLLNECGKWQPDAIEAELAHVGTDQIRRAYHRALYWDERVKMAEWWAEKISYCPKNT